MKNAELQKLLNELADATAESVRPELAEGIKDQIPQPLTPHKGGMDTANIVINLRVNKLAAAAVIILTMLLCAHFLGGGNSTDNDIFREGRLLIGYLLGGRDGDDEGVRAGMSGYYQNLLSQGIDVAYYGDNIDLGDGNAVLMQWKISKGQYKVIFADLQAKTVSAERLIEMQRQMLQKKRK